MTTDIINGLVFIAVVLARFLVPLAIPRYPLPGIIAALVLDAVDQTIFQQFTDSDLEGYQSYDKALDVYYLAIAYISTLRNWANQAAFEVGQFLWYYRLIGVVAFELASLRAMLLIFPNTFEYYFIAISAVRLRWDPMRLTQRHVIGIAAFIWIVIKLPQEYWIHVAKLDTTDLFKEHVLGVSLDTGWGEAFAQNLWIVPVVLALVGGGVLLVRWVMAQLPPPDWRLSFNTRFDMPSLSGPVRPAGRQPWFWLAEKTVLIGLVSVVFVQTLPGVSASLLQIVFAVGVVVVANSLVSHWFAQRGRHWSSVLVEFAVMGAINYVIATLYIVLMPFTDGRTGIIQLLFLTLLLTLIVTLYDHYRPIHDQHVALAAGDEEAGPLDERGAPGLAVEGRD
ncbi:MAG TPA: hypothetical protein VEX37_04100 [Thermomicrobiales bacterium]|nr:hypothetical protein [Thermomicrobiales bacterium]